MQDPEVIELLTRLAQYAEDYGADIDDLRSFTVDDLISDIATSIEDAPGSSPAVERACKAWEVNR